MIFRRRTTEQVYATLQQVQRRITEQGGPAPAPAARAPGTAPFRAPGSATPMRTPPAGSLSPVTAHRRDTPIPADQPAMTAPLPPTRGTLELPTQVAVTLMLVWLSTVVGAFLIGRFSAPTNPEVAPAPVTSAISGRSGDAEAPAQGRRLGDSILVLRWIPRYTDREKAEFQAIADRLNKFCRENPERGWKDYFAVREPLNGGLELVFGYANGQFGIDRQQFHEFAAMLQRPLDKKGAGYVTAAWKTVE